MSSSHHWGWKSAFHVFLTAGIALGLTLHLPPGFGDVSQLGVHDRPDSGHGDRAWHEEALQTASGETVSVRGVMFFA